MLRGCVLVHSGERVVRRSLLILYGSARSCSNFPMGGQEGGVVVFARTKMHFPPPTTVQPPPDECFTVVVVVSKSRQCFPLDDGQPEAATEAAVTMENQNYQSSCSRRQSLADIRRNASLSSSSSSCRVRLCFSDERFSSV